MRSPHFAIAAVAMGCLYLACTETGAEVALGSLKWLGTDPDRSGKQQAIVVLTGNTHRIKPAIRLQRLTQLPLLVAGRDAGIYRNQIEAGGARVHAVEARSADTEQNAAYVTCALRPTGISRIYLVTDDTHTARAAAWFRYYGMQVTPAATPPSFASGTTPWLPTLTGTAKMRAAVHEYAGMIELLAKRWTGARATCPRQPLSPAST